MPEDYLDSLPLTYQHLCNGQKLEWLEILTDTFQL